MSHNIHHPSSKVLNRFFSDQKQEIGIKLIAPIFMVDKNTNSIIVKSHSSDVSQIRILIRNIEDEINDFFRISRLIFFGRASKINQSNAYNWLKVFSLHCRLCERKLIIEKNELKRFNTPK